MKIVVMEYTLNMYVFYVLCMLVTFVCVRRGRRCVVIGGAGLRAGETEETV